MFFLKSFFFQHLIHKQIFNTFCTNLHPIFLQLNLNSIKSNLHPTGELNSWIEVPFNLFEFNSIQFACNVIQYFHWKWNLISTLKSIDFFHQLISWLSCIINSFFSSTDQLTNNHWYCTALQSPSLLIQQNTPLSPYSYCGSVSSFQVPHGACPLALKAEDFRLYLLKKIWQIFVSQSGSWITDQGLNINEINTWISNFHL